MRVGMISILALISMPLHAVSDFDREQVQQRISPVGKVHVQESAPSTTAVPPKPEGTNEVVARKGPGQAIYEQYCIVCHRDGVAGAPKFRDTADWGPRRAKQTIDSLTATVLKGLNAMPAKGTCQECSDADIKAAIEYMVPPS